MKYIIMSSLIIFNSFISFSKDIVDTYKFIMRLNIPKIINNTQSLGSRKYVSQRLEGELKIIYRNDIASEFIITNLINKSHKINNKYITYKSNISDVVYPRLSYIGDNRLNKFKIPNIVFYLEADPSYNIGDLNEDNSLYLLLAGVGASSTSVPGLNGYQIISKLKGYATGTLGCGCHAYGHISPTRYVGPWGFIDQVTDVASVYGTWIAKWQSRDYK